MISTDLRRIVDAMTGEQWKYNRELAWLNASDPVDGEIYTIANLSLDSTNDGKCYGASRNGAAIAALANHADALVALVEACERWKACSSKGLGSRAELDLQDSLAAIHAIRETP